MLGSDVVGFHTKKYCDNFLECCDKLLDCHVDIDSREVRYCGRKVLVRVIPAGITYDSFSKKADGQLSQNCPESLQEILAKYEDKKIIVGVDRIDYTKGLPEKVKAYQAFLEKHSGFDGKVVYVQIAIPCRQELQTYQEFSKEVKDLVADTKRKLVDKDFKPSIEMIYDKFSHDDLAVLYRKSHVAWVTPLKDGLNLVAMEYVACQSRDRPGVLILSKFAGAAETMDQAVQVDPCEIADMVNGLHSALTMTPDERKERMAKLQETVQTQSAEQYRDDNIKALFEGLVA